mmetsp:Transcript_94554/g.273350  ORF Transcript_94554/g.273350 Transcript_94554/m.273350 type:complete len:243 (+) Transcript_94554:513-1241(+)
MAWRRTSGSASICRMPSASPAFAARKNLSQSASDMSATLATSLPRYSCTLSPIPRSTAASVGPAFPLTVRPKIPAAAFESPMCEMSSYARTAPRLSPHTMKFLPAAQRSTSGCRLRLKASKSDSKASSARWPRPGSSTAYSCIVSKCSAIGWYVMALVPAAPTISKLMPRLLSGERRTMQPCAARPPCAPLPPSPAAACALSCLTSAATVQSSDIRKARSGRAPKADKILDERLSATREFAP